MAHRITIIAITENSPGVLHRITDLFTRRKMNVESLTVSATETEGLSRFTIVVETEKSLCRTIVKQIRRIIEVRDAYACENRHLAFKEVALYRVETRTPEKRTELTELAHRYGASVVSGEHDFLIIEKSGTEDDINALYLLLEPFGLEEFVRSGRIALLKTERVPGEVYLETPP